MTHPTGTIRKDYEDYANHCLRLAAQTPDRKARIVLREMAAEWLRLLEGPRLNGTSDGYGGGALPQAGS